MCIRDSFHAVPGASPTAPPIMQFPKIPSIPVDFTDTNPHDFRLEYLSLIHISLKNF